MCLIGIDFDNTIVSYDAVLYRLGLSRALIRPETMPNKRLIRDQIRRLPNGEQEWQRLQALIYGPAMAEAALQEGGGPFLRRCRRARISVGLISHKTPLAGMDETGTDLRAAAMAWMRRQRFFDAAGLGLTEAHVYFESTRHEKIERIRQLGCTHFIDDLEETFLEEGFPAQVEKILYAPGGASSAIPGVRVAGHWSVIDEYVGSSLARR